MIKSILKEPEGKTLEFKKEAANPVSFEKTPHASAYYLASLRARSSDWALLEPSQGPSGLVVSKSLSKMNSQIYESPVSLFDMPRIAFQTMQRKISV